MEQLKYKIGRQVLYIGATQLVALSSNILDNPPGFDLPVVSCVISIPAVKEKVSPVYDLVSF